MIVAITDDNGLLARLGNLPTAEAKRWNEAFAEGDGRQRITFEQVGSSGSSLMTLEQFCEEVEVRLSRWREGRYLVCEAAQVLADAQGLTAEIRCMQMWEAASQVEPTLTVRFGGIPTAVDLEDKRRFYMYTVLQSDVNDWLSGIKAGFTLSNPYTQPNAKTEVGRGMNNEEVQRREFVAWLNSDNQRSADEQAKYDAADQKLKRIDELDKAIRESEPIQAINWGQKEDKDRKLAALKSERVALWAEIFPANSINKQTAVVTDSASDGGEPNRAGPAPLTTGDLAFCFAGIRCNTEQEWKALIGKGRGWVEKCLVQPGTRGRGGAPKLWNPVCIGAALVRDGHAKPNSVRAKFQTVHLLQPWLETWKTYEADNFDIQ